MANQPGTLRIINNTDGHGRSTVGSSTSGSQNSSNAKGASKGKSTLKMNERHPDIRYPSTKLLLPEVNKFCVDLWPGESVENFSAQAMKGGTFNRIISIHRKGATEADSKDYILRIPKAWDEIEEKSRDKSHKPSFDFEADQRQHAYFESLEWNVPRS